MFSNRIQRSERGKKEVLLKLVVVSNLCVVTVLGSHIRYSTCQIITLWFITIAKVELWRIYEILMVRGSSQWGKEAAPIHTTNIVMFYPGTSSQESMCGTPWNRKSKVGTYSFELFSQVLIYQVIMQWEARTKQMVSTWGGTRKELSHHAHVWDSRGAYSQANRTFCSFNSWSLPFVAPSLPSLSSLLLSFWGSRGEEFIQVSVAGCPGNRFRAICLLPYFLTWGLPGTPWQRCSCPCSSSIWPHAPSKRRLPASPP